MDNKPNPDKQGKTPKNGQTILILVVADHYYLLFHYMDA